VIVHEEVQETGSDPLYPEVVINTGSPEGRYVVELSRKLLLPFDPPILWSSPKQIPEKFHTLLSRLPVGKLGTTLINNHLLAEISLYPDMLSTSELPPLIHRYCGVVEMDLTILILRSTSQNPWRTVLFLYLCFAIVHVPVLHS